MQASHPVLALAAALGLALVHLFAGRLRFIHYVPRSRWLSFAGGASVAYVFLHLLPELAAGQEALARYAPGSVGRHAYLVALTGLALFYGLERLASESRHQQRERSGDDSTSPGVFWVHIGSFAVYNLLIGYLLVHREDPSPRGLLLFTVAMALHFTINDFGLREHHKQDYQRVGRWLLAASVLTGWGAALLVELGEAAVAALVALLAGAVILNVLKEEVPDQRHSNFGALALGMVVYSALLLTL